MNKLSKTVVGIAVAIIIIGILVGAYLGGWWLQKDTVNRQASINNGGYNRQTSLVEDITKKVVDAQGNIPPQQRTAIVALICEEAQQLTGSVPLGVQTQLFVTQECFK